MNLEKYSFPVTNGGLLLSTEPFPNGNMLGATAQLSFLLGDKIPIAYFIGMDYCERTPGTFSRYPNTLEDTSVDDYLSLACSKAYANDIYSLALERFGFITVFWPVTTYNQWILRFQGFWQHTKISAGVKVGPLGRLIWALSIILAAKKPMNNQDSWMQSHLMVLVKERRGWKSWIGDLAVSYWRKKKVMTTSEIAAEYIGVKDHPLVEAWKGYQ